jgi:hypothetical protein
MTGKGFARVAVLVALLALGLAAPVSAELANEGRVTLRLDRGLRSTLSREGVKVRGLQPAVGRLGLINLPVEGGGVEPSGKGRLVTAGGIEFAANGRRATFRDLVLDTAFGTLSAKLGGRRLGLATVGGLSSERHGFAIELGLSRLTLTGAGAATIGATLGMPGLLRGGRPLASATAVSRLERVPVIDGRNQLNFGDSFFEKLKALRVNTKPIGNAWALGTYFAIPDTVGWAALDLSSGVFQSDDGIALKQFESSAELALHNVAFNLGTGIVKAGITTPFNLPSEARVTPLVKFRLTVAHKNANTGELSGAATGTLTTAFADRLNESFAVLKGIAPPFAGGEPVQIGLGLQTRHAPR